MDSPSHFSNLLSPSNTVQFKSRKPSKRTEATKSINVKKLAKSMDQSIATTEDVNGRERPEQHFSSPASRDVPAGNDNMLVSSRSTNHFRVLGFARDSKARQNIDVEMLEKTTNEPIPASVHSCQRLDQHSRVSRDISTVINSMLKTCLAPAPAVSVPPKVIKVAADNVFNNVISSKLGKSIATSQDVNNHKQSEQHLSSPSSGDVPAGIVSMPASMLSPAPVLYSVPILEAAGDAFESYIISSKQVRTEEAKVNDHVAEECPRDNFNSFQQKDETNPGLSEVMDMFAENGSTEEVSSSACNSALVSVGGYKVKKVAAPMLRNIIEKHGDIAVNCSATTVAGRSMFLQSICDIMQTLEASKAVDIKESEIEDMLDMVEELAKHKLQVGWLKKRLDEILNAIKAIKSYPDLRNAKAANTKSIQESENALKCYKNGIQLHKAKIQESEFTIKLFERKVILEQEKLGMMRAEAEGIKDRVSSLQSMVKILTKGTLIQDLH